MFKTVKRIIDWCGEFKGRLYAGFVVSFFSHLFTALPIMLAAYTIGLLLQSAMDGTPFDTGWVWKSLILLLVLVFLRFLFDYLRTRFQEAISYELVARDRLAVGDALKRVSLGYFQQVSTGNILNSLTTGLGTLEGMGIRMIDNFVGGYLNFAVVFLSLLVFSPRTAVIALAALSAMTVWRGGTETGALTAVVTADGQEIDRFAPADLLDAPRTYSYNGVTLTVAAEDGNGLRVSSSDCPTQDCVHTGTISRSGQSIVCLPARIVIQLTGGAADSSGVDIVIG